MKIAQHSSYVRSPDYQEIERRNGRGVWLIGGKIVSIFMDVSVAKASAAGLSPHPLITVLKKRRRPVRFDFTKS